MKHKIFTLLIVTGIFLLQINRSSAQFFTVSGQITNNGGSPIGIAFAYSDTAGFPTIDSIYTDVNGNYMDTFLINFIDSCSISFTDCNSLIVDTTFIPSGFLNVTWTRNYCPTIQPQPVDVSFTTSYCTCDNTFYIETDTTGFANNIISWDFGDGTTSSLAFPTHAFTSNNIYNVCVTVSQQSSTTVLGHYCHKIGFDSSGNAVTRMETSGFNLKVILPGAFTVDETVPFNSIIIYPNPAGDNANLILYSDAEARYEIKIFSVIGQQVKSFSENAVKGYNNFHLDLQELSSGNYFMTTKSGERRITTVFVK